MEVTMNTLSSNRRKYRSENVHEAIRHQLIASARRAQLCAMVLADHEGFVFSATKTGYLCEQIAALAPILAERDQGWQGSVDTVHGTMRLTVTPIQVNGRQLYLTACDGEAGPLLAKELNTSGIGIGRILA